MHVKFKGRGSRSRYRETSEHNAVLTPGKGERERRMIKYEKPQTVRQL